MSVYHFEKSHAKFVFLFPIVLVLNLSVAFTVNKGDVKVLKSKREVVLEDVQAEH